VLDRVGVCAVVSASVGEGGKMLDGLLVDPAVSYRQNNCSTFRLLVLLKMW
jgi:hypothetical protein